MDLLDSLRALLRRWPITVAFLVLTLGGTLGAFIAIPWQYESQATMVFLSSRQNAKPVGGNPWLAFDTSLTITAEVVARGMSDKITVDALKARGFTAEYTVGLNQESRGPLMDIVATSGDPQQAQKTLDALVALSYSRLRELQRKSSILPDATISMTPVIATKQAEIAPEPKIRMLIIVFAGGMLLTLGVPLFVETLAQKRARERVSTAVPGPVPAAPAAPLVPPLAEEPVRGAFTPTIQPGAGVQPSVQPGVQPGLQSPPVQSGSPRPANGSGLGSGLSRPANGVKSSPARRPSDGEEAVVVVDSPQDPWASSEAPDPDLTAPQPIVVDDDLFVWSREETRRGGDGPGAGHGPARPSR
ncbi:hypothetical protein HNP84_009674 [Thermocatellispora tengchongensis]|uniref:Polysaccharide chain length determinant N-terminal domain-containing protein n=1 Tax=Thermocatellispora tengchongensis TaxID=1073253 RepID=A0A840PQ87_9ACTN|nr:hypothetical protein [Thermocatellispora tengchongensis]MBB5139910.1 hypothetical protein [Thermocatellispora tengchongensis]